MNFSEMNLYIGLYLSHVLILFLVDKTDDASY